MPRRPCLHRSTFDSIGPWRRSAVTDPTTRPTGHLVIDPSALVRRYVADVDRKLVLDTMAAHDHWCVSSMARTEATLILHQVALPGMVAELIDALRDDWESFWVVPLDDRLMARAAEIGATYGVRLVDAIHLATADRLPGPVQFLTFDRRQIPAGAGLGFEVISPLA